MLPVVPIWRKVFCNPVKLFINNGPMFDVPLTFNDETHVTLFESVVVPETFNDDVHVVVRIAGTVDGYCNVGGVGAGCGSNTVSRA